MAHDVSNTLSEQLKQISVDFKNNIQLSNTVLEDKDNLYSLVEQKSVELANVDVLSAAEIVNLQTMVEDFRYIRQTLRENADNGRRILSSLTLEALTTTPNKETIILSFAELNKSVTDTLNLYIQSYKQISGVLLNIDRIGKINEKKSSVINNSLTINNGQEAISTVDLIKRLTVDMEQ